jgi:hypothetical protein
MVFPSSMRIWITAMDVIATRQRTLMRTSLNRQWSLLHLRETTILIRLGITIDGLHLLFHQRQGNATGRLSRIQLTVAMEINPLVLVSACPLWAAGIVWSME